MASDTTYNFAVSCFLAFLMANNMTGNFAVTTKSSSRKLQKLSTWQALSFLKIPEEFRVGESLAKPSMFHLIHHIGGDQRTFLVCKGFLSWVDMSNFFNKEKLEMEEFNSLEVRFPTSLAWAEMVEMQLF